MREVVSMVFMLFEPSNKIVRFIRRTRRRASYQDVLVYAFIIKLYLLEEALNLPER
jgi:hypothetical protein